MGLVTTPHPRAAGHQGTVRSRLTGGQAPARFAYAPRHQQPPAGETLLPPALLRQLRLVSSADVRQDTPPDRLPRLRAPAATSQRPQRLVQRPPQESLGP